MSGDHTGRVSADRTRQDKDAVRAGLLAARREIAAGRDREADDAALANAVEALTHELDVTAGGTVAAYEALRTEPPTAATIDALVGRGIRVIVPITLSDNDLDWSDATDKQRMPLGPDAIAAATLVLTPGLAVDLVGTRLGRGGGSYDRALARCSPGTTVVVVLHPCEVHPVRLPREDHDVPVDGMLTVDGPAWF